ncbi:MAG: hypothetical protein AVDCRST_MAG59-3256, partial [uncultured Thermomicrobiales bacterium]
GPSCRSPRRLGSGWRPGRRGRAGGGPQPGGGRPALRRRGGRPPRGGRGRHPPPGRPSRWRCVGYPSFFFLRFQRRRRRRRDPAVARGASLGAWVDPTPPAILPNGAPSDHDARSPFRHRFLTVRRPPHRPAVL